MTIPASLLMRILKKLTKNTILFIVSVFPTEFINYMYFTLAILTIKSTFFDWQATLVCYLRKWAKVYVSISNVATTFPDYLFTFLFKSLSVELVSLDSL